jgi:hypothetical protein
MTRPDFTTWLRGLEPQKRDGDPMASRDRYACGCTEWLFGGHVWGYETGVQTRSA